MSRIEAEALLEDDGDFLIRYNDHYYLTIVKIIENVSYRESKGKYVLTAKGHGKCHHLLLIDEHGKVNIILSTKKEL